MEAHEQFAQGNTNQHTGDDFESSAPTWSY